MVESHPDAPEVHRGPECLADRFPEDGSLIHVRVEIFLSSVKRHELLIVLQLPGNCYWLVGCGTGPLADTSSSRV